MKGEGWRKIYLANTNQRKSVISMLTSDKVDFRARKNNRNKQEILHSDKELKSIRIQNYTSMYIWIHTDAHTYLRVIHCLP